MVEDAPRPAGSPWRHESPEVSREPVITEPSPGPVPAKADPGPGLQDPPEHLAWRPPRPAGLPEGRSLESGGLDPSRRGDGASSTAPPWARDPGAPNYLHYPSGPPQPASMPNIAAPSGNPSKGIAVTLIVILLAGTLAFGLLDLLIQPEDQDPDRDDDGVPNELDPFPDDPSEWADLDGDGVGDNSDPDLDGDGVDNSQDLDPRRDLAVSFRLDWVNLTTPVGSGPNGDFYAELYSNRSGEESRVARFDDDGGPLRVPWRTRTSLDWEVEVNVPDNETHHHFNLRAFEINRWTAELLDIDGSNDTYGLTIYYDLTTGTWTGDDSSGELDGSLDNLTDEYDARLGYNLTTVDFGYLITYTWIYQGQAQNLTHRFDPARYNTYLALSHRIESYDDFIDYATPAEPEVIALAGKLEAAADARALDLEAKANYILSFVQGLKYTQDNTTQGIGEYPRYPVETLVDQMGDCEDTAVLYISLMEALGYQAVLLILPEATIDAGHAAAGVALEGVDGSYYEAEGANYYYAETTTTGWRVGEMPELDGDTAYVYPV